MSDAKKVMLNIAADKLMRLFAEELVRFAAAMDDTCRQCFGPGDEESGTSDEISGKVILAGIYMFIKEHIVDDEGEDMTPGQILDDVGKGLIRFETKEEKEAYIMAQVDEQSPKDMVDAVADMLAKSNSGCGNPNCKNCYPDGGKEKVVH